MSNRFRTALFAATALGCVMAVSPAVAQTETDTAQDVNPADQALAAEEPIDPNAIIVTARRFEERLQDVPISITVFNQEQLTNRNIVNPSELATYTPSLSVNRQFGSEKSSFSIRGFTQELGTQPSVAVYFADVVAPRAQALTGGGNGTLPGTLFDLQNVQVLKGPQGTLFGRNTTGGAVLLVPQRPTDRAEGFVEGTLGNYDAIRVQAVVNAPLSDSARLRLGFDKMTRDGYLRNRSGIGPDDFANVDYYALRASLVLDLTDTLENYTIATYNDSDTHGQIPRLIAAVCPPTVPIPMVQFLAPFGCAQLARQNARGDGFFDVENDVPDPQIHLRQWQLINTTTWEASDTLTIKNIASYAEYREASTFSIFGDRLLLPLPPTFTSFIPFRVSAVEPGASGDNAAQYTITEELQFQGRSADDRFIWQLGGYLEISNPLKPNTQVNQLFVTCADAPSLTGCQAFPGLGGVSVLDQEYRFRNLAAYAQATYKITDQISFTGGLRYTSDRVRALGRNAIARPITNIVCSRTGVRLTSLDARSACLERFEEKSAKPTWLANIDYKPNDDVLFYAKYARGYRQGTLNLVPLSAALVRTGPEKVDTYEVGAKATFDGALRGNFNIAAFYNNFTDQQIQASATSATGLFAGVLLNAGKSRIYGVEVDASLLPFDGFRLDLAYAYLNAKLKSIAPELLVAQPPYDRIAPSANAGTALVYSPKHKLTVTGTYTLPLDESIGEVSLGATYTHTAKQFATHADDPFAFQVGFNPGLLPATDLLNLNLNWDSVGGGPIDLSLFATNVTNEKHRVAVTQGLAFGFESAILAEPRMYGARLRYRFGEAAD